MDERDMQAFFGSSNDAAPAAESGYILFYQATTLQEHFLALARQAQAGGATNAVANAVAAALAADAAGLPTASLPEPDEPQRKVVLPAHLNR
jgi:hypothetical protein